MITTRAVSHWHCAWRREGTAALISKGPTGPHCLLTQDQQHELRHILRRGAKDYGFSTDGWTLARIRRVITETFGVAYADLSRGVAAAAAPEGLDQPAARPPRPGTRGGRHRRVGRTHLIRHRKKGAESGAWICFEDESGSGLTGAVERTWAPAGQIPTLHVGKGSQSKLSVAALCCYRPRQQPRMLYRARPGRYHDRDLIALLDEAHQRLAAPILWVWDNLSGHRSGRMRRVVAARTWWLPSSLIPGLSSETNNQSSRRFPMKLSSRRGDGP